MSTFSAEGNADQLAQLSSEVSRIAGTLARLSNKPAPAIWPVGGEDALPVSPEVVTSVIRARRLRARYFDEALFADPAWDIMLELLHAEIIHQRVSVSTLCSAAAVPATTALRWVKTMVQKGLLFREDDTHDARRVFIELAPETSTALRRYFAHVAPAVI